PTVLTFRREYPCAPASVLGLTNTGNTAAPAPTAGSVTGMMRGKIPPGFSRNSLRSNQPSVESFHDAFFFRPVPPACGSGCWAGPCARVNQIKADAHNTLLIAGLHLRFVTANHVASLRCE